MKDPEGGRAPCGTDNDQELTHRGERPLLRTISVILGMITGALAMALLAAMVPATGRKRFRVLDDRLQGFSS